MAILRFLSFFLSLFRLEFSISPSSLYSLALVVVRRCQFVVDVVGYPVVLFLLFPTLSSLFPSAVACPSSLTPPFLHCIYSRLVNDPLAL